MTPAFPVLPAPQVVVEGLLPRSTTAVITQLNASQFEYGYTQRVAAHGATADYIPDIGGTGASIDRAAYAVYSFIPTQYQWRPSFRLVWQAPPAAGAQVWIGFSNWAQERWDWYPLDGAYNTLELGASGFTPYIKTDNPGNGTLLAAVLVLDTPGCTLSSLGLDTLTPGWQLAFYEEDDFLNLEYQDEHVAVDSQNNVIISASAHHLGQVGVIHKLSSSAPQIQWANCWDNGSIGNQICDLAVDQQDNIYALGINYVQLDASRSVSRISLLKVSPDGSLLWQKTYAAPLHADTDATAGAIAIDSAGAIYVTGGAAALATGTDVRPVFMKLDPAGNLVWATSAPASVPSGSGVACAITPGGGVVFACNIASSPAEDILVLQLDADGGQQWQNQFSAGDRMQCCGLAVDAAGAIYGAANVFAEVSAYYGLAFKLDPTGQVMWRTNWIDPVALKALTLGQDGNLWLAADQAIIAMGAGGQFRYAWRLQAPRPALLTDLAFDHWGLICFGGYQLLSCEATDMFWQYTVPQSCALPWVQDHPATTLAQAGLEPVDGSNGQFLPAHISTGFLYATNSHLAGKSFF